MYGVCEVGTANFSWKCPISAAEQLLRESKLHSMSWCFGFRANFRVQRLAALGFKQVKGFMSK